MYSELGPHSVFWPEDKKWGIGAGQTPDRQTWVRWGRRDTEQIDAGESLSHEDGTKKDRLGGGAHTFNHSTLEAEADEAQ